MLAKFWHVGHSTVNCYSPASIHPGAVNMNMNVDPASSNINMVGDMKSDYEMTSLEVDSSS